MTKEANLFSKKVEDWGKTKFKPAVKESSHRTSQNPFTKPQNFNHIGDNDVDHFNRNHRTGKFSGYNNRGRGGRFNGNNNNKNFGHNNNGARKYEKDRNNRVKFNTTARDARPEVATPWTKFRDEIDNKQREETLAASQVNMDSEEAKKVLKQREINYRKLLMEQKKQEITQWEDFEENEQDKGNSFRSKKSKQNSTDKLSTRPVMLESHRKGKKQAGTNVEVDTNVKEKNKGRKQCKSQQEPNEVNVNKTSLEITKTEKPGKEKADLKDVSEGNRVEISMGAKKKNKKKKQPQTHKEPSDNTKGTVTHTDSNEKGTKTKKKRKHLLQNEEKIERDNAAIEQNSSKRAKKCPIDSKESEGENYKFIKKDIKETKHLLTNDELQNFDAKSLSFHQKDVLRRIITKGVTFKMGSSLEQCLKNRKYQVVCKEKKNKCRK